MGEYLGWWFRRAVKPRSVLIHAKDQVIGDAFMQLPFFQSARERFPEAHITLCVSLGSTAYSTSLAAAITPYIDEIIEHAHLCDNWTQIFDRKPPLGSRRFDLVIDMQKNWWKTLAIRRIRHRVFISAAKHYVFSDRIPAGPLKPPHLLDQLIRLLDAASGGAVPIVPQPRFGAAERAAAKHALPEGAPAIGLVPGAGEQFKRWPIERYVELARLQLSLGRRVAFVLGPNERDLIEQLRQAVPAALFPGWHGPGRKEGGLTPLEVAALGERLDVVVTNDCGTAHMLALGCVPMICLFGATNPVKYRPASPTVHIIRSSATGAEAMSAIDVASVCEAIEVLMSSCAGRERREGTSTRTG